jgi:arginyl-tRNA synthetase
MKYLIELNDSIEIHEKMAAKKKKYGKGDPTVKIKKGDSLTYSTGDLATIEQRVDEESDMYDKIVKDSKGNIIHEEHRPLSKKGITRARKSKNE